MIIIYIPSSFLPFYAHPSSFPSFGPFLPTLCVSLQHVAAADLPGLAGWRGPCVCVTGYLIWQWPSHSVGGLLVKKKDPICFACGHFTSVRLPTSCVWWAWPVPVRAVRAMLDLSLLPSSPQPLLRTRR